MNSFGKKCYFIELLIKNKKCTKHLKLLITNVFMAELAWSSWTYESLKLLCLCLSTLILYVLSKELNKKSIFVLKVNIKVNYEFMFSICLLFSTYKQIIKKCILYLKIDSKFLFYFDSLYLTRLLYQFFHLNNI